MSFKVFVILNTELVFVILNTELVLSKIAGNGGMGTVTRGLWYGCLDQMIFDFESPLII